MVPRLAYSLNLASNSFSLCPTIKMELERKHFPTGMAHVKPLEVILKRIVKESFQNISLRMVDLRTVLVMQHETCIRAHVRGYNCHP